MKKVLQYVLPLLISVFVFSLTGFNPAACDNPENGAGCEPFVSSSIDSCYYGMIPLHGRVKFVNSFADLKIRFVTSFPDLKVKFVENFPDDCGEWEVVESFPDFTIEVVESFPDIEVEVVESFPGLP